MNQLETMAELFSMLGEHSRLKIVNQLSSEELCVHELAERLNMSLSSVSHQLRLLKTTRIVKFRKSGKHVYYRLDDHHIKDLLIIAGEHTEELGKGDVSERL